jgi:hypothetical protein
MITIPRITKIKQGIALRLDFFGVPLARLADLNLAISNY